MNYVIIGIEPVSYPNRNTGEIIQGTLLYLSYESEKIVGVGCEKVWIKKDVDCSELEVGFEIKLYYNKYGKVEDIGII